MSGVPVANEVPGLSYFTIDGAEGQKFFRCHLYHCTVSTRSCSDRWTRAQSATGFEAERLEHCRGCERGAVHSGRPIVRYSPLYGAPICPRTRRWTNRMIWDRIGVSAYNRQREFEVQIDCKGHVPQFRFDPRRLAVIIDGERVELRDYLTADLLEMVLAVLRTTPGRLVFTRARAGAPAISTVDLSAKYRPKAEPKIGAFRQRRRAKKSARGAPGTRGLGDRDGGRVGEGASNEQ